MMHASRVHMHSSQTRGGELSVYFIAIRYCVHVRAQWHRWLARMGSSFPHACSASRAIAHACMCVSCTVHA